MSTRVQSLLVIYFATLNHIIVNLLSIRVLNKLVDGTSQLNYYCYIKICKSYLTITLSNLQNAS